MLGGRIRAEFIGWLNRADNRDLLRGVRPAHARHGGSGAFYVLLKLPGVPDALEFNRAMVRDHRVASIPGFAFGLTDTAGANYQRLSYGALDAATVAEGVQRFVAAVRDWYGR